MKAEPLHQRLDFDVERGQVLDESRRYILMRADVLMGLFSELPSGGRAQALKALTASVRRYGGDSVRAYHRKTGSDAEQLFEVVGSGAASLGWGVWRFEHSHDACTLRVSNSPFAHAAPGSPSAVCAPILGMFEALCSEVWNREVRASETSCSACRGGAGTHVGDEECVFQATIPS